MIKPETVVGWHRLKFAELWAKKSKRIGRPTIDREVVKLVRKIYSENFNISTEKIHEQLILLGLKNPPAPNTIAKYIKDIRKPPTKNKLRIGIHSLNLSTNFYGDFVDCSLFLSPDGLFEADRLVYF